MLLAIKAAWFLFGFALAYMALRLRATHWAVRVLCGLGVLLGMVAGVVGLLFNLQWSMGAHGLGALLFGGAVAASWVAIAALEMLAKRLAGKKMPEGGKAAPCE